MDQIGYSCGKVLGHPGEQQNLKLTHSGQGQGNSWPYPHRDCTDHCTDQRMLVPLCIIDDYPGSFRLFTPVYRLLYIPLVRRRIPKWIFLSGIQSSLHQITKDAVKNDRKKHSAILLIHRFIARGGIVSGEIWHGAPMSETEVFSLYKINLHPAFSPLSSLLIHTIHTFNSGQNTWFTCQHTLQVCTNAYLT